MAAGCATVSFVSVGVWQAVGFAATAWAVLAGALVAHIVDLSTGPATSKYPHLGFDPAPGDLETVRLMVSAIGRVDRDSGTAQTQLSKLGTSDGI